MNTVYTGPCMAMFHQRRAAPSMLHAWRPRSLHTASMGVLQVCSMRYGHLPVRFYPCIVMNRGWVRYPDVDAVPHTVKAQEFGASCHLPAARSRVPGRNYKLVGIDTKPYAARALVYSRMFRMVGGHCASVDRPE